MSNSCFTNLSSEITNIDKQIAVLLMERFNTSNKLLEAKRQRSYSLYTPIRNREFDNWLDVNYPKDAMSLKQIFDNIKINTRQR